MGHLKKSDRTGHLLKNAAGHLVNGCAGAPVNTCFGCVPPIPDVLYATFAGLSGVFVGANGKHALQWVPIGTFIPDGDGRFTQRECSWILWVNGYGVYPFIELIWGGEAWRIHVCGELSWRYHSGNTWCYKSWYGEGTSCAPCVALYEENLCYDFQCLADIVSCLPSVGATCVVSLT